MNRNHHRYITFIIFYTFLFFIYFFSLVNELSNTQEKYKYIKNESQNKFIHNFMNANVNAR